MALQCLLVRARYGGVRGGAAAGVALPRPTRKANLFLREVREDDYEREGRVQFIYHQVMSAAASNTTCTGPGNGTKLPPGDE